MTVGRIRLSILAVAVLPVVSGCMMNAVGTGEADGGGGGRRFLRRVRHGHEVQENPMRRSLLRTAVAGFGILTALCRAPGCHRDSTAPEVSTTPNSVIAAGETDLVAKGGA